MHFLNLLVYIFVTVALISKNAFSAEGMPQFNAYTFPTQLFWLFITFLLLYFFISLLILPRIRDNLRLRKNKISNDLERAELIKHEIEKIRQEYDQKITNASNRANDNIKNALEKADQDLITQIDNVKQKINKKINESDQETLDLKNNFAMKTNEIAEEIATLLVEKILGKSLSKNDIELLSNKNPPVKDA